MVRREFSVSAEEHGKRLDHVLRRRYPEVPRRLQLGWFAEGHVFMGRGPARKSTLAEAGELCRIEANDDSSGHARGEQSPLSILWQDEQVLVVDKPAGMASAALAGSQVDSVAAHLLEAYPDMGDVGYSALDAGLIHRLDTDTSGVLVAAKQRVAFEELSAALRAEGLTKSYLAWTKTAPALDHGVVATWLRSDPRHRRRMVVARPNQAGSRLCETSFEVVAAEAGFVVLRANAPIATRHQVRVHLAHVGAPLVGDALYGGPAVDGLGRHALHAERVRYEGGEYCSAFDCRAPIPRELAALTPRFAEAMNSG